MSATGSPETRGSTRVPWWSGVRLRLLLAFLGITALAVLTAAAGLYAFTEVGARLDVVERRVPPTLATLELSRSAERIVAVAPALLASTDRARRDAIRRELSLESERLQSRLSELSGKGAQSLPLDTLAPAVSSLLANLDALESVVAERLALSERIRVSRGEIFRVNAEAHRLLAPWHEVLDEEVGTHLERLRGIAPLEREREILALASLLELQRSTQDARGQFAAAVDLLLEATSAPHVRRLSILDFQLGLTLGELARAAPGLDARLQPLLLALMEELRVLLDGPRSVVDTRRRELELSGEGERLLGRTRATSTRLIAETDRLGGAAEKEIVGAVRSALRVQRLSARVLLALVALTLLASVLIVWLYVGRNVVRRLSALGDGMNAVIRGDLSTPVEVEGVDEIAFMGRAVDVFRRNTLERDQLLEQQARTTDLLERKVERRTAELEMANTFKSRFLAAASHDLRQPLHALNLFVAQLHDGADPAERERLVTRIDIALASMNELFEELLDMAKLDAGVLEPTLTTFPASRLLERLEATFEEAASGKGLGLRVVPSEAWVRGDFVLLERVLFNLVSNALRYTDRGGVLIGCRRCGTRLRFDVIDSGPGISPDRQARIFDEFYQLPSRRAERVAGLGLGLAIVERLADLLRCPVDLQSKVGRGSRFSVSVARASSAEIDAERVAPPIAFDDPLPGKLVVVLDDDRLVLEGMGGVLRRWGCEVLTASTPESAAARLASGESPPDLIISDYQLGGGRTGIEAIAWLRRTSGTQAPAFLISGDTTPERLYEASASGYRLLCKPVSPMTLRTVTARMLRTGGNRTGHELREAARLPAAP